MPHRLLSNWYPGRQSVDQEGLSWTTTIALHVVICSGQHHINQGGSARPCNLKSEIFIQHKLKEITKRVRNDYRAEDE